MCSSRQEPVGAAVTGLSLGLNCDVTGLTLAVGIKRTQICRVDLTDERIDHLLCVNQ